MTLKDNNEYVITIDDILNNSEFSDIELTDIFGEKIDYHLINVSKKTYRIMYSAYNGWNIEQQRLEIQEIINNDTDKQQVMLEAIVEYIRGIMYSGMDMQDYLPSSSIEERIKNQTVYPPMVKDILITGGLWIKGEIIAADDIRAT